MSKFNSVLHSTAWEEQASLIAAFNTINSSYLQIENYLNAAAQSTRSQFMGKYNNSEEHHLQNAKRANMRMSAEIRQELALAIIENDKIALDHDSHEQSILARNRQKYTAVLEQFFDASKSLDMSLTALLDLIHANPFSSSSILESKL